MIGRAWVVVWIATVPLRVQGTADISRIEQIVRRPEAMCGSFDQAKIIVGLQHPIRSAGRFCIVSGKGILWRTLQPFPADLKVTRDEIVELRGERVANRITAEREPTVRMLNDLLFSLVEGRLVELERAFVVTSHVQADAWQVSLAPRLEGMKRVVRQIDIAGGANVTRITVMETGGDRTEITFSGVTAGREALRPDEIRLLP